MKVHYITFRISQNKYFLNYLCETKFYRGHLVDSGIPSCRMNVCGDIFSKLLIVYMGLPRLGVACHTETSHEHT